MLHHINTASSLFLSAFDIFDSLAEYIPEVPYGIYMTVTYTYILYQNQVISFYWIFLWLKFMLLYLRALILIDFTLTILYNIFIIFHHYMYPEAN